MLSHAQMEISSGLPWILTLRAPAEAAPSSAAGPGPGKKKNFLFFLGGLGPPKTYEKSVLETPWRSPSDGIGPRIDLRKKRRIFGSKKAAPPKILIFRKKKSECSHHWPFYGSPGALDASLGIDFQSSRCLYRFHGHLYRSGANSWKTKQIEENVDSPSKNIWIFFQRIGSRPV